MVTGYVDSVKKHKSAAIRFKCNLIYEPYMEFPASSCEFQVDSVQEMLQPSHYCPGPDSYFVWEGIEQLSSSNEEDENDDDYIPIPEAVCEVILLNETTLSPTRRRRINKEASEESDSGSESLESSSDSSDDDSQATIDDGDLGPDVDVTWVKSKTGNHTPVEFDGDVNDGHPKNVQRNGQADPDFFPPYPEPVQCFLAFLLFCFFATHNLG